jgi:hypothetical protein
VSLLLINCFWTIMWTWNCKQHLVLSSMLQLYKDLIHPISSIVPTFVTRPPLKKALWIVDCVYPLKENTFPLSHPRDVGSLSLLNWYFCCRHSNELCDLVPSLDHRSFCTRQCHSMHELTLSVPRSWTSHQKKTFSLRWFVVRIFSSLFSISSKKWFGSVLRQDFE